MAERTPALAFKFLATTAQSATERVRSGCYTPRVVRLIRASVVVVLSVCYFSYVFQISQDTFLGSALGDWGDPYFINFLLEYWHHSLWSLTDPSSPPMYFPARRTLGYSHGLILYAPFYLAIRPFVDAFQTHTVTLFLVMETGSLCLYLILRKFLGLAFIESLLLSAFFVSSQNVINGATGTWSQRASVFLIPPILLIVLLSARMPKSPGLRSFAASAGSRPRLVLAWLSGLLCTLLFTQDFYTAQFALLFAALFLAAALLVGREPPVTERLRNFWKEERRFGVRVALLTATLATAWTLYLWMFGGGALQVFGVRIASRDWRRPAVVALAGLFVFVRLRGGIRAKPDFGGARPWLSAFAFGGLIGCLVFLWIYLGAYREIQAFPEEQLMNSLALRDPSRWQGPLDFVRDLGPYDTLRSFKLVFLVGILAWVPWFQVSRKSRLYCLWFLFLSFVVLVIPLRFNDFSIWKTFVAPVPGFSVIRDPKRIIYLYELAVVLVTALFLIRLPRNSLFRVSIALLMLYLLVTEWNRTVFDFARPMSVYRRWVEAPIDIDPSCESFFVKGASEEYMSRSGHMWSLYGVDSMFVSLNHSIPTLNGYSASFPNGWGLTDPQEPGYSEAVRRWIERHNLRGVCEFDIEKRTMKPYRPTRATVIQPSRGVN
jgi:hypothetical protein